MRTLALAITAATIALPFPVSAGVPFLQSAEKNGNVHPSPENYGGYLARRTGAFAAWYEEEKERQLSYKYDLTLKFAECVSHFNPNAADKVLVSPIGARNDHAALVRLAESNRGCAVEERVVHPLLLRAALAEMELRGMQNSTLPAGAARARVGVPDVVDGYPLASISRCQVQYAPELVTALLNTRPGEAAERAAADTLFAKTPQCGASKRGRLTATAARLAVIDAALLRRSGIGKAQ